MIRKIFILLIRGYQKWISPHMGDHCRFYPTCSAYMIEALQVHGLFKGLLLGTYRILRCNPFGKSGFDPVPKKGKWTVSEQEKQQFMQARERFHKQHRT